MLKFIFCIHNHQPVGNFDHVVEEAYSRSYEPFLKKLSEYPDMKLSLHVSGFLLDWLSKNRSGYIELLRSMVESGQIELLGGGYYEPVLSVLPFSDRIGQINMLSDRHEELFGVRPRGIWLAERVWDSTLPKTLGKAGIEYVVVDDYHFIKAGLTKRELCGYYVTEELGSPMRIFPGSERLRYLIPFESVERLKEHLGELECEAGDRVPAAIFADDGEKFGVWPGTDRWVFEQGWLESFLNAVTSDLERFKPVTFSEFIDEEDSLGRVYLPSTSYMEMGEWALPAEASREYKALREELSKCEGGEKILRFLQGGVWRNFLAKYPESDWMHKRMLMVSEMVSRASKESGEEEAGIEEAKRHLYMAQCNDAYWHGVFGGLYLPHLRERIYRHLIKSECLASTFGGSSENKTIELVDFNADCKDEVVLKSKKLALYVSPSSGGSIMEIDALKSAVNITNTVSRWYEGYHMKLKEAVGGGQDEAKSIHDMVTAKEEGLEKLLKFDNIRRASLRDRFFETSVSLKDLSSSCYEELGDFVDAPYGVEMGDRSFSLVRSGTVKGSTVRLSKQVGLQSEDSFGVEYVIDRPSEPALFEDVMLAVEFNLCMPCCDGPACYMDISGSDRVGLGSSGVEPSADKVTLSDEHTGVSICFELSEPLGVWRYPIETVSLSEAGFERNYQGTCLIFLVRLKDAGGSDKRFSIKARITQS